jgi:hypothetical protein
LHEDEYVGCCLAQRIYDCYFPCLKLSSRVYPFCFEFTSAERQNLADEHQTSRTTAACLTHITARRLRDCPETTQKNLARKSQHTRFTPSPYKRNPSTPTLGTSISSAQKACTRHTTTISKLGLTRTTQFRAIFLSCPAHVHLRARNAAVWWHKPTHKPAWI